MTSPTDVDPATGLRADTFALATLADGGRAFPALVGADGTVTDLSDRFHDLHEVVADWPANLQRIGRPLGREPPRRPGHSTACARCRRWRIPTCSAPARTTRRTRRRC